MTIGATFLDEEGRTTGASPRCWRSSSPRPGARCTSTSKDFRLGDAVAEPVVRPAPVDALFKANRRLYKVYLLKEQFGQLWDYTDPKEAGLSFLKIRRCGLGYRQYSSGSWWRKW